MSIVILKDWHALLELLILQHFRALTLAFDPGILCSRGHENVQKLLVYHKEPGCFCYPTDFPLTVRLISTLWMRLG